MNLEKSVVTIGGGTGTFTVLSGLRHFQEVSLTAIVSSADDGGSTGRLRDAYGILPPGDARQALVALAEQNSMLRQLFTHRFSKGDIAGHNFGNLFLTALSDIFKSDARALEEASQILRIRGKVLSVSDTPAKLIATFADGTTIFGEHAIDTRSRDRAQITKLAFSTPVQIAPAARSAIEKADMVVLGPGDLYTSTIAALLPSGACDALRASQAPLVYVMNLFTKGGQTSKYGAMKHIEEIERHIGCNIDIILMSTDSFPQDAIERYALEGEEPVKDDLGDDSRIIRASLTSVSVVESVPEDPVPRSLIRHNPEKLARVLRAILV